MMNRREFLKLTGLTLVSTTIVGGLNSFLNNQEKSTDTVTFLTNDGFFQFTVRCDFLKIIPKRPEKINFDTLHKYQFPKYLHNEIGPAVVYTDKIPKEVLNRLNQNERIINSTAYWLNGELLFPKEWEKRTGNKIV